MPFRLFAHHGFQSDDVSGSRRYRKPLPFAKTRSLGRIQAASPLIETEPEGKHEMEPEEPQKESNLTMTTSQSIVVLTGAGVSAESGIRTFRASDGLWEDHRIEDVATPAGFARNPALVHDFYNGRRRQLCSPPVAPNAAHKALADFERRFRGNFLLVTQNIDDLHERAGSRNVLHMHGELLKARCRQCGALAEWRADLSTETPAPCCDMPGSLRPHVVWFGEIPLEMERIERALTHCDLFVAIGTSGHVYPAAGFCDLARASGARTVEINLEQTAGSHRFGEHLIGAASRTVPDFFAGLPG